ncbi:MAG: cyclic nucleotide-binding domain-containing protein, partial [Comamonadaceae bacterium]
MNAPLRTPIQFDVQGLVHAIAQNTGPDAFQPALSAKQWELLGTYLQPFAVKQGQVLIEQHTADRTVYLVESGQLTVHYEDDKGRLRLASVGAGSA